MAKVRKFSAAETFESKVLFSKYADTEGILGEEQLCQLLCKEYGYEETSAKELIPKLKLQNGKMTLPEFLEGISIIEQPKVPKDIAEMLQNSGKVSVGLG